MPFRQTGTFGLHSHKPGSCPGKIQSENLYSVSCVLRLYRKGLAGYSPECPAVTGHLYVYGHRRKIMSRLAYIEGHSHTGVAGAAFPHVHCDIHKALPAGPSARTRIMPVPGNAVSKGLVRIERI